MRRSMSSRMRPTAHDPTRGGDVSTGAGVILRCTAKALLLLGGTPRTLADPPPTDDDWYLNLLWIERRKCLLVTHAGTLFSVVLIDVRAADLRPIGPPTTAAIEAALRDDGLPADALGSLDPEAVTLAKTASRSVLGFMNQMATDIEWQTARRGGLALTDPRALNHYLQHTLRNRDAYVRPIELVRECVQRKAGG